MFSRKISFVFFTAIHYENISWILHTNIQSSVLKFLKIEIYFCYSSSLQCYLNYFLLYEQDSINVQKFNMLLNKNLYFLMHDDQTLSVRYLYCYICIIST